MTRSNLTIIVAADTNDTIGKDNKLIWHLPDDLKRFKRLTSGHHIIMGRKTFDSFPGLLPNRKHIVITRQKENKEIENVIYVNSMQEAIKVSNEDPNPFVIGGGEIYKIAMDYCSKIELTRVNHSFDGDTHFTKIDTNDWTKISDEFHDTDEKHKYSFNFETYEIKNI
jgi:dihydrofolate reductase